MFVCFWWGVTESFISSFVPGVTEVNDDARLVQPLPSVGRTRKFKPDRTRGS